MLNITDKLLTLERPECEELDGVGLGLVESLVLAVFQDAEEQIEAKSAMKIKYF